MTVQTTPQPDLFYDYYGFPPDMYQLHWPAKGDPQLANQTRDLLEARGIKCGTDEERGYDHGVFVPLLLLFPDPKVPGQFLFCQVYRICHFHEVWFTSENTVHFTVMHTQRDTHRHTYTHTHTHTHTQTHPSPNTNTHPTHTHTHTHTRLSSSITY